MARPRTKKRTHVGAKEGKKAVEKGPKSMVIRIGAGEIGKQVGQLVKDMRLVMEPHTASRLRERKANKLRDYTTMCGPLGVSHLLLFSRSSSGNVNLRIALTPRGPTLHFRVENYSLCKDIIRSIRHAKSGSKSQYMDPPLLVMNHFTYTEATSAAHSKQIPKHLESLITTVFQSLFPPISPQATPLTSIHRVLLLERQLASEEEQESSDATYTLFLRHYHIATKVTGLAKPLRRINKVERAIAGDATARGRPPNLGRLEDMADFFLGDQEKGYVSASETEVETDAEVEVLAPQVKKVLSRSEREALRAKRAATNGDEKPVGDETRRTPTQKRAVRLTELGPRMKLRLTKVEEGVCGGKVLWHQFVTKSKEEEKTMDAVWEQKRQEKAERQRVQRENVEKKRKERKVNGNADGAEEDDEDMDDELADADEMDWDDDQWDSDAAENEGNEDDPEEDT